VGCFAGLDVSLEETALCIVDDAGRIVRVPPTSRRRWPRSSGHARRRWSGFGLEACSLAQRVAFAVVEDTPDQRRKRWWRRHLAGKQRGVPRCGGHGVTRAHYLSEFDGLIDDRPDMSLSLFDIAVEQGFVRVAEKDEIKLPREVKDVVQAGSHALTREGRHEVRGIANGSVRGSGRNLEPVRV